MNSTFSDSRLVRMAARSPALTRTGPVVERNPHAQFLGHDLGESGLAETRRAMKQDMIEGLASLESHRR